MEPGVYKEFLDFVAEKYPQKIYAGDLIKKFGGAAPATAIAAHLIDLGLINAHIRTSGIHGQVIDGMVWLSSGGLSHLDMDGGLGKEVNAITIKIHESTIKDLVEAKILASDLKPDIKQALVQELKAMPAAATKHLIFRLMDFGLSNIHRLPDLFEQVKNYMSQGTV